MSWTSDASEGFGDSDLDLINIALPHPGLALKSTLNARVSQDLMRVYPGRDAGQRVLSGEIRRGSLRQIDAVIRNFDLEGFTSLSEELPGIEIIDMLNDYLAVVVDVAHQCDGSILKFMGDGLMAMFDVGEIDADARAVLDAVALSQERMAELNTKRKSTADFELHAGAVRRRDPLWQHRFRQPFGFHGDWPCGQPDRSGRGNVPVFGAAHPDPGGCGACVTTLQARVDLGRALYAARGG